MGEGGKRGTGSLGAVVRVLSRFPMKELVTPCWAVQLLQAPWH